MRLIDDYRDIKGNTYNITKIGDPQMQSVKFYFKLLTYTFLMIFSAWIIGIQS